MKSDIGFVQEELPSGKIANSSMRLLSFLLGAIFIWYLYIANASYELHFTSYTKLVSDGIITDTNYNALVLELKRYEDWVIGFFLVGIFAPKAIQKAIELKFGTKQKEQ